MLKSSIFSAFGPGEADTGDIVTFILAVQNIGTEAGYINALIWFQENSSQVIAYGEGRNLAAGIGATWYLPLIMPNHYIDVWAASTHRDEASGEWVFDESQFVSRVNFAGPVVAERPDPKLVSFSIDDQVAAGAQVRAVAGIRNEGTGWAFCRPLLFWSLGGEDYEAAPDYCGLNPGESRTFDVLFTMPDATIQVMAVAQWWAFDARIWWATDEKGPFTVAVAWDPWPHLVIPSFIVTVLGLFNWPKGSWEPIDIPVVDIPPWDIMIGEWVLAGLQYPVDWLNWTIQQVKGVWGIASAAWDTAVEAWNNADSALEGLLAVPAAFVSTFWGALWPDAWDLVQSLTGNVLDWAHDMFKGIWDRLNALEDLEFSFDGMLAFVAEHLGEIEPFKTLFDTFNSVYQFMADVGDEAWAFFSNPVDWMFDKIDDWFNEEVSPE